MILIRGKALNNIECKTEAIKSKRDKPVYGSCRILIDSYRDTQTKIWYKLTQDNNSVDVKYVNPILEISYFLYDEEYSRVQYIRKQNRYELSVNSEYLFQNPRHMSMKTNNSIYLFSKIFGNAKRIPLVQEIGETQIPINDKVIELDGFNLMNKLLNYSEVKSLVQV